MAQFFNPTEQSIERKRRMAEAIMAQGKQPQGTEIVGGYAVKQSPLAGLARALTQGIGGSIAGQADMEGANKAQAANQTMADAIEAYSRSQAGGSTNLQNGEKINWNTQTPEQGNQLLAKILMSNPDTASMGMQTQLGAIKNKQDQEMELLKYQRERADKAADFEKEAQLKRELIGLRGGTSGGFTTDPITGEQVPVYSNKPLPVGALKLQDEALAGIGAASGVHDLAKDLASKIDTKQLELGPVKNFFNGIKNWAGQSDNSSVAYANMKRDLEKLRNDTLLLNKGVQTEGDAVRAMNAVVQSVNDPAVFKDAMLKLDAVNQRATELQKLQVNSIRSNYNVAPYDFEQLNNLPSPVPGDNKVPTETPRQKLERLRKERAKK